MTGLQIPSSTLARDFSFLYQLFCIKDVLCLARASHIPLGTLHEHSCAKGHIEGGWTWRAPGDFDSSFHSTNITEERASLLITLFLP